ncbi:hypothetical protein GA0074694_2164 [Micromonospora inyonensis]|uniref:Uncharacterized protein n=1 Tax=Micromonospora inyonensis TaxID=47866 RepID=A0A1C6RLG7_9ACTN|nr:hypothetical protein GA0074694_2164 [Micromonospora inyonensis]
MHRVAFGTGITPLPPPVPGTFYLVPLVVGLAAQHRDDLLVPHDTARDMTGSIIGVRRLARPITAEADKRWLHHSDTSGWCNR